jgi:hypothetical protein
MRQHDRQFQLSSINRDHTARSKELEAALERHGWLHPSANPLDESE